MIEVPRNGFFAELNLSAANGLRLTLVFLALLTGCKQKAQAPAYQAVAVERRDIVVSAQASG
ncbi:MAG TPA: hypothetical protein VFD73_17500, partial [Gemmatimonadales bacterium]|nr:hypothetical protein [Gemmatimonadales bacterium]